jgi:L-2-hydroxyglutarate oxidase
MIDGGVECGPNAVLAFGKESYKWLALNFAELLSTLSYPGFQRVAFRYWKAGFYEVRRSLQRPLFAKDVRELIPEIRAEHLIPARAGIRAQAVRRDGTLLDDFEIKHSDGFIHVLNAPSPAATASLAIGNRLSRLAWERIE